MNRPEVHGHRGSPLLYPENTLPGFEHAIASGADFVELDLQATRDGVLIVSHDPHLPTGELIYSLTGAEALDRGCTPFSAVLNLPAGLNIEIKSYPRHPENGPEPHEFARLVLAAGLPERVLIQSFDFRVLRAVREIGAHMALSALWEGEERDYRDIASEAGSQSVSIHFPLIDATKVGDAHHAGIRVLTWTANGPATWETMVAAGVDGIITDDPAGLIAFLRT